MNKLGFGFLRLPLLDSADEKSIDLPAVCSLTDAFIHRGGEYFDTAYTYLGGMSEVAVRECAVKRHPREIIRIADKLPPWLLKEKADAERIFAHQLERCGVEYFDSYLIHGMDEENYDICLRLGIFDFLRALKERGLARRIGFSFHDDPALLDRVLTEQPDMEFVQLQINYLDWRSSAICSKECREVARRHCRPIIVMEPVKGGTLAAVPEDVRTLLRERRPQWSDAKWAIAFAASLDGVERVLSGMNSLTQIEDNMEEPAALTREDFALLEKAAELIRAKTAIGCTACSYCRAVCPKGIAIPEYLALYNDYAASPGEKWKMEYRYARLGAPDCIRCGECKKRCPQHLDVPDWLEKTAKAFE